MSKSKKLSLFLARSVVYLPFSDEIDQQDNWECVREIQELIDRDEPIVPTEKSIEDCGMMGFDFLCSCGESVRQTNKFCPECGHPLGFKGK